MLCTLLFWSALTTTALAEEASGGLKASVVGEDDLPIPGATVTLTSSSLAAAGAAGFRVQPLCST